MTHNRSRGRSGWKKRANLILFLGLMSCCVMGLWSQSIDDQSALAFPRIEVTSRTDSGIALFNPNAIDASVSLALTRSDGQAAGTAASVTVPALGQIARTAGQLFGAAEFSGSMQIGSPAAGLVAYYETFDVNGTFMDGADAPSAALNLVFPVVPDVAPERAEIALLNSNTRNTLVQLKLWNRSGNVLGEATVQLPGQSSFRGSVRNIFASVPDLVGSSHITAVSRPVSLIFEPQPVSGTSLFSDGTADIAALNALTPTQLFNSGAIPYFRVGAQYFSTLSVANYEPAAIDVTLTAIGNDGVTAGSRKVTIPGNGGLRQSIQGLFSVPAEKSGWMLLQGTGRFAAAVLHGRSDAGAYSAVPMQKDPRGRFVFPQIVQGFGYSTEISLANPGPNTSTIDLFVIDAGGETVASNQVTLPPSRRISQTLDVYMPEVREFPGGALFVRASQPVFATAAVWTDTGSLAANFIPQPVPDSYVPAPLKTFAVTGTVTLNGQPAKDFAVVLAGPGGSRLVATEDDGSYAFTGLPAGNYSLMVERVGLQFAPPVVDFTLSTASKRQDFQAFTAENGIIVQPPVVPAGSPDVLLTIYGRGFNPTSTAYVGALALKTTFVGPTELQAILPASLIQTAAEFSLFVITDGSRRTDPYPMVAFVDKPKLDKVETSPQDLHEGIAGANLVLTGSGFLDGAKVEIGGKSDGITVTIVNSTQIVAVAPWSYFVLGGNYPVTVVNPYPANSASNALPLKVFYPRPAVERITPQTVSERIEDSSGPLTLDVFGYGFRRGAVVLLEGEAVPTAYCESSPACLTEHLIATVPPAMLQTAGFKQISVRNPDPSLDANQAVFLRVESLQPTITSVDVGTATLLPNGGYTLYVVVNGTNFDSGTSVEVSPVNVTTPPDEVPQLFGATRISSTQLYFTFPVTYPDSVGQWAVDVRNPQPGGGVSPVPGNFFINTASFVSNPFLVSLSPGTVPAGGPTFTLTINGLNFQQDSQVNFYSIPLATTFVSPTQLRAVVPDYLIFTAGKKPISVTNSGNGGTSNRLFIEIQ